MAVETLGEAMDFSWRVTVRCAWGPREGMKRVRDASMAANWIAIARMDAWSLLPVGEAGEPFEVPALRGPRRVRLAFGVPATPQRATG